MDLQEEKTLIAQTLSNDKQARFLACQRLGELYPGGDGTVALVRSLADAETDVRRAATHAIWNITSPLFVVLQEPDSAAANARRQIQEAGAVPALLDLLKDSDTEVREWAAQALGRIGDISAINPLVEMFEEHPEDRGAAACALAEFGRQDIDQFLISKFASSADTTRYLIVCNLDRSYRFHSLVSFFESALSDPYEPTRNEAVERLQCYKKQAR